MGFSEMQIAEPPLAREWRVATRELFTSCFRAGYRAVDFLLDRDGLGGRYVLSSSSV